MALLALAGIFALWGLWTVILATRFRKGSANYLLTYRSGWLGERGKRSLPYGLYPISAILLVSAADVAAQVAGVGGPLFDGGYLFLMLVLIIVTAIFMVTKPSWLAPPNTPERTEATTPPDDDPAATLPRPLSQMSTRELKKWARANPEQAHRLAQRLERDTGQTAVSLDRTASAAAPARGTSRTAGFMQPRRHLQEGPPR